MITQYRPAQISCATCVGLSGVTLVLSAVSELSLLLGVLGCLLVSTGLFQGTHFFHRLGTISLIGGLMMGLLSGLLLELGFIAAMSLLVSYDIGAHAISLGYYTDEENSATLTELVRITQTLSVTLVLGSTSYLALFLVPREPSIVALVVLLFGLIVYTFSSHPREEEEHESRLISRL